MSNVTHRVTAPEAYRVLKEKPEGNEYQHAICKIPMVQAGQNPYHWCPNCSGWVSTAPMVDPGSGYDPDTKVTDISKQTFWCIVCGSNL